MAESFLDASTLNDWLNRGSPVTILDVRPSDERADWFIPGSVHVDAYHRLKAGDTKALADVKLDKNIPVVTVCAAGKTSQVAAQLLTQAGYNAYSLKNGMKGWSLAWNRATVLFDKFQV